MPNLPPKYDPAGLSTHGSAEETNDPLIADHRNFLQGREVDVSVKLPQGSPMATLTLGIEATLRNVG